MAGERRRRWAAAWHGARTGDDCGQEVSGRHRRAQTQRRGERVGARCRAPRQQQPGTEQATLMADNILNVGGRGPG
jgi:hypothetical protein